MPSGKKPKRGFDDATTDFGSAAPLTEGLPGIASQPAAIPTEEPPTNNKNKPHYHGHRERLRERFLEGGADALPDYELLELVLFRAIPRRDVKPIAKSLIDQFGSFAEVISADLPHLLSVPGLGQAVATELKIVQAAAQRLAQGHIKERTVIGSGQQLLNYCTSVMAYETREHFRILFLDQKHGLIKDEVQNMGTVDHTAVYPREVVKRALELGASALILVHNHPSGDPTPSSADIAMTRRIVEAANTLGVKVHDHIVIGKGRHTSFRAEGML